MLLFEYFKRPYIFISILEKENLDSFIEFLTTRYDKSDLAKKLDFQKIRQYPNETEGNYLVRVEGEYFELSVPSLKSAEDKAEIKLIFIKN